MVVRPLTEPSRPDARHGCLSYFRKNDKPYMSSEDFQGGSSVGDVSSNMSYDYSSSRSSVGPSIHDAAQGLAHLAMLAWERAPPYAGPGPESSISRGRGHAHDHAPFQHAGHHESFRRDTARAPAGRGPSLSEFGENSTSSQHRVPSMVWLQHMNRLFFWPFTYRKIARQMSGVVWPQC